jgi:hypothetical protein
MKFATVRKDGLSKWLSDTGRTFKTTDNIAGAFECDWQNPAIENGFNHISIFCSIGEFAAHVTDHLRDYRYDKYEFNKSLDVDEVLFRYYSKFLLIVSEVLTDLQDLWILANYKLTTKEYSGLNVNIKRQYQNNSRATCATSTMPDRTLHVGPWAGSSVWQTSLSGKVFSV